MGMIRKIDSSSDEYKTKLTAEQVAKMEMLERELSPSSEMVMLGKDWFELQPFDMEQCTEFSKFQAEYREILKKNPKTTFDQLLRGEDSIVKKMVEFLKLDVPVEEITYKQFKYLMFVITKNYMFTGTEDSEYINAMTPFFFV